MQVSPDREAMWRSTRHVGQGTLDLLRKARDQEGLRSRLAWSSRHKAPGKLVKKGVTDALKTRRTKLGSAHPSSEALRRIANSIQPGDLHAFGVIKGQRWRSYGRIQIHRQRLVRFEENQSSSRGVALGSILVHLFSQVGRPRLALRVTLHLLIVATFAVSSRPRHRPADSRTTRSASTPAVDERLLWPLRGSSSEVYTDQRCTWRSARYHARRTRRSLCAH